LTWPWQYFGSDEFGLHPVKKSVYETTGILFDNVINMLKIKKIKEILKIAIQGKKHGILTGLPV